MTPLVGELEAADTAPSPLREAIEKQFRDGWRAPVQYSMYRVGVDEAQIELSVEDIATLAFSAIRSALLEDPTRAEELGMMQVGWWRGREVHEHMPACDEAPNRCRPVFAIQSREDD